MNSNHVIVTNFSNIIYSDNFIELIMFFMLSMMTRTMNTLRETFKDNIYVLLMYQVVLNLFYTYIVVLFVLFLFQSEFMIQYQDFTNLLVLVLLTVAVFTKRETKVKFFYFIVDYVANIATVIIDHKINTKETIDEPNTNRTDKVD